jgi:hypothetical protein
MRTFGVLAVAAVVVVLGGCGGEAPAPVAETVSAEAKAPARLPIGEITPADVPALMAVVYPDGVPATVKDLGTFVIGERVGLLTGAETAEACADCGGSVSLFYLARTDAGFVLQADYRDFHKSGSGGKLNRDLGVARFGGLDGGPSYAGFSDVNSMTNGGCTAKTLTVAIFTEAGPRTALTAPFGFKKGDESVRAMIVGAGDYQADFAISYRDTRDDFVAPYLFVNQGLRPSFPVPEWTQAKC